MTSFSFMKMYHIFSTQSLFSIVRGGCEAGLHVWKKERKKERSLWCLCLYVSASVGKFIAYSCRQFMCADFAWNPLGPVVWNNIPIRQHEEKSKRLLFLCGSIKPDCIHLHSTQRSISTTTRLCWHVCHRLLS